MLKGSCHCAMSGWTLNGDVGSVTACNCTLCRRYGALWAYGHEGEGANLFGDTKTYERSGKTPSLEVHFCAGCGNVIGYRSLKLDKDGTRKVAVNVRLAPPELVLDQGIDHFDGLNTFEDLPNDGRHVRDLWA